MWLLSNKESVKDSGLLEGFCDCHCHLLPGVDDGIGKLEETILILKKWDSLGVKEVWMTPHVMEDYPNTPANLKELFAQVCADLNVTMQLHLAAEHMMDGLFVRRLQDDDLLPCRVNGNSNCLLLETSYYSPPMNMDQMIDNTKEKGYTPLLAHPERYQYMSSADYRCWKQQGVLLQLNVPSLVGAYGCEVQHKAEDLLNQGMYDCCGSDTHSLDQVEVFLDSMISKKTVGMVKRLSDQQYL